MGYSRPCPYCNANLDPGEKCDCQKEKKQSVIVKITNRKELKLEKASRVV